MDTLFFVWYNGMGRKEEEGGEKKCNVLSQKDRCFGVKDLSFCTETLREMEGNIAGF